jgi:sRNA-binding regulator protein Hfq
MKKEVKTKKEKKELAGQQAPQRAPSGPEKRETGQKKEYKDDFYFELKGKAVNIFSSNGELIKGIIQDTSRYMIKVDVGGKVIYLNKAFIQKISLI